MPRDFIVAPGPRESELAARIYSYELARHTHASAAEIFAFFRRAGPTSAKPAAGKWQISNSGWFGATVGEENGKELYSRRPGCFTRIHLVLSFGYCFTCVENL